MYKFEKINFLKRRIKCYTNCDFLLNDHSINFSNLVNLLIS